MKLEFLSSNVEQTYEFASVLAGLLEEGSVILMHGQLGSGKTAFAKGIGKGLDIKETITSPTFNIVRCYFNGKLPLYHIDAYRLEGSNKDIGLDEYLEGDGICLVEWPDYIQDILPLNYLEVSIEVIDLEKRKYQFVAHGSQYESILERVDEIWKNK